jgi:hypothetical protein
MKAKKVTVAIKTETLHIDSVPALLQEASNQIFEETAHGKLVKEDGDTVEWSTESVDVEI